MTATLAGVLIPTVFFFFALTGVAVLRPALPQKVPVQRTRSHRSQHVAARERVPVALPSAVRLASLPASPLAASAWAWPGALGYRPELPAVDAPALDSLVLDLRDPNNPDRIGGIDYSDPVGRGVVPLIKVAGRGEDPISRSFRVADFASHDGAPYARISEGLVGALERLRARTRSLVVLSGYRHRAYNETIERSAAGSQHIAGRAADVWSGTRSPLELAEIVLQTQGCRVGLGLGANTLHVDLRGHLASWTYAGAALDEPAFDAWVRRQCGGIEPADEAEEALDAHDPTAEPPAPAAPADSSAGVPAPDSARVPAPARLRAARPDSVKTMAARPVAPASVQPDSGALAGAATPHAP